MRSTVIKARDLSPALMARWIALQNANPPLITPALRPELFRIVGTHHPEAQIAVLEEEDSIIGFLPFERHPFLRSIARPIPICDYHDCIHSAAHKIDAPQMLQAAGLKTWTFENLLVSPPASEVSELCVRYARRVRLESAYADYAGELRTKGKSLWNISNKQRLLARDHGEVVFLADAREESILDTLLEWKVRRFEERKPVTRWISESLHEIFGANTGEFRGVLSTLRAGGKLVAAHFGMQSAGHLYYWFSAFNPEFSRYTPGWLLIHFLLQSAAPLGCHTVDLGAGGEDYKAYFSNCQVPVTSGHVELPGVLNAVRRGYRGVANNLRANEFARTLLGPVARLVRRF